MSKLVRLHARDGNQVTSFIHHDDVVKKEELFFFEIKFYAFGPLGNPWFLFTMTATPTPPRGLSTKTQILSQQQQPTD